MEKEIVQLMGSNPKVEKSEYDNANDFVNGLVINHRSAISKIVQKHTGKKVTMYSVEKLKREVKQLMKAKNPGFASDLAIYLIASNDKNYKSIDRSIVDKKTILHSIGAWKESDEAYDEAVEYLMTVKGYTKDNAETALFNGGSSIPDLKGWSPSSSKNKNKNKSKDPFDWNLAMETTGKVAQTIFHIGSIFSKQEDAPVRTFDDSDSDTNRTKSNLTRNIIIGVVITLLIGTVAYFAFRPKK